MGTTSATVTIVSSEQERKRFLEFPYEHYRGDAFWVPPLRIEQKALIHPAKNPFFQNAEIALFLGEIEGRTAGRIAAIIDRRYNAFHGTRTGFFGFFECVNDPHLAGLLVRAASGWLKGHGMETLLGPANPGMMDVIGVQIDHFDEIPSIMMPANKPYYDELLQGIGLRKAMDLFSFYVTSQTIELERANRAFEIVRKRIPGLTIRELNLRSLSREIGIVREIFNKAWERNWGFIPLSEAEFGKLAADLKQIIDPELAHFAEIDGKPVGFTIPLPDYNQILHQLDGNLFPLGLFKLLTRRKTINKLRTALMGVLPEHRGKGIDAILNHQLIVKGLEKGYVSSELGWVLETNIDMIRVAERFGSQSKKTYRMYELPLA